MKGVHCGSLLMLLLAINLYAEAGKVIHFHGNTILALNPGTSFSHFNVLHAHVRMYAEMGLYSGVCLHPQG